ncbi:C40 family peptidase [Crocinitomix catalasitica]|nr:C40 family peptidase [Crocinitomix catalasitica]
MLRCLTFISLCLLYVSAFDQDKKIDKIEILYDQGYFGKVLKKSRKLQARPEYDYSALPSFYISLSLFRLAEDRYYRKRHKNCIPDAIDAYRNFLDSDKKEDYVKAHFFEIAELKTYVKQLELELYDKELFTLSSKLKNFQEKELKGIKALLPIQIQDQERISTDGTVSNSSRDRIVAYAKTFIGVKYVWAGSDDKGFDCSGYTNYVYKKFGIILPRTANGQKEKSKKVKIRDARKGDLVFFSPTLKITHVGLVVSDIGGELTMVHASSSRGVIVTNIETSTYWNPKLKAAGTYL